MQEVSSVEHQPYVSGKRLSLGLLAAVALLLVIQRLSQPMAPAVVAQPTAPTTDLGAITACEGYVADRLKAPASAKFSGWLDSSTAVLHDGALAVRGYVDAQNGYGALIRTDWVCTVRPSGSAYSLQSVELVPR